MNICIIPARGGSKRIPGKNLKELCGKPLVGWSIEQAKESVCIERVYVSTEDEGIKEVANKCGAEVLDRRKELVGDKVKLESVINDHIKTMGGVNPDVIVLLQPTSPLRKPDDIDNMYKEFGVREIDACVSVVLEEDLFLWENNKRFITPLTFRKFDRELRNEFLCENGSIYMFKQSAFEKALSRYGATTAFYRMQKWQKKELDWPEDWEEVEFLMRKHIIKEEIKVEPIIVEKPKKEVKVEKSIHNI